MTTTSMSNESMSKSLVTGDLPKRYHPALASFHWIIALLIFTNVILAGASEGGGTLFGFPVIGVHMITGIIILVLLTLRLITRFTTKHPEPATIGNTLLDKTGVLTHYALYLFTFSMTISGIVMAAQRGYFARIFGIGSAAAQTFHRGGFGLGALHGLSWLFLGLFIFLHVSAALYHQFIRKDHLLSRMWVGK